LRHTGKFPHLPGVTWRKAGAGPLAVDVLVTIVLDFSIREN